MFTRSHLPPMLGHHYGPWDHAALLGLRLQVVWITDQNDQRLRSPIHFTIRQSTHRKTRDPTKSIYGIPPPNRRTIGTKESVDRTIPTTGDLKRPKRVDALARAHYNSAQQPDQYYHWAFSQPNPLR